MKSSGKEAEVTTVGYTAEAALFVGFGVSQVRASVDSSGLKTPKEHSLSCPGNPPI